MKKILIVIKDIIFALLAMLVIYGIIGNISATSEAVFNTVRYSNYTVLTGSMEPSISPGDYITVRKVDVNSLKVGDIITFKMGDSIITHMIKSIEGEQIITKGTANNVVDDPITKEDVLGKYLFKISKMGYVMSYLSTPSGLILIVGIVAILVFWDLSDPNKKKNKHSNDINEAEYKEFLEFKKSKENI